MKVSTLQNIIMFFSKIIKGISDLISRFSLLGFGIALMYLSYVTATQTVTSPIFPWFMFVSVISGGGGIMLIITWFVKTYEHRRY